MKISASYVLELEAKIRMLREDNQSLNEILSDGTYSDAIEALRKQADKTRLTGPAEYWADWLASARRHNDQPEDDMALARRALDEWFGGREKWPPVHKLDALIASVAYEARMGRKRA